MSEKLLQMSKKLVDKCRLVEYNTYRWFGENTY